MTRAATDKAAHTSMNEGPRQHDLFDCSPVTGRPFRSTLCARLAALFRERSGEWLDGRELATVAGAYGWRTRVSDLRRAPYFLRIDNRLRREDGYVVSEYCLVVDGEDPPEER